MTLSVQPNVRSMLKHWQSLLAHGFVVFVLVGCASTTVQTPQPGASTQDRSSSGPTRPTPAGKTRKGGKASSTQHGSATEQWRSNAAGTSKHGSGCRAACYCCAAFGARSSHRTPRGTVRIRLSQAHLDQGDSRAAFQHARKAIALAGSETNKRTAAWLQLANVYEAQGKDGEAKQIRNRYGRYSG